MTKTTFKTAVKSWTLLQLLNLSTVIVQFEDPIWHLLAQSQRWNYQNSVWNLFEVDNKNTRTASLMSFWCVIVNFEQISHIVLMFSLLTFLYKFQLGYRLCIYIEVNESRYIALFVISGSIKKLYTIDCVNIYLCPVEKCGVTPHFLYRDSLTLIKLYWSSLSVLKNVISFTFHLFLPNY